MQSIYEFYAPKSDIIGFVSIPHSGMGIPEEFKDFLVDDLKAIYNDVDFETASLFNIETLQSAGIAVLVSNIARTCIDLNRQRSDALLHWKKNTLGEQVVHKEPEKEIAESLLKTYYDPYYSCLTETIQELQKKSKVMPVVDFHSMPSKASAFHLAYNPNQEADRPDFCLSDIKGQSCHESFINKCQSLLREGYEKVNINNPYFGGYLTHHINTFSSINNIQIEVNRSLYMDESNQTTLPSFDHLKEFLTIKIIELMKKS